MNFGYIEKSKHEIIKNYEKKDNKLIINYLDGSDKEVFLKDEIEEQILNKMLGQAKERNMSLTVKDVIDKRRHYILQEICNILLGFSSTLRLITSKMTENNLSFTLNAVTASGFCILAIINGVEYKIYNDQLKELKKYAIYLDLLNKLEKSNQLNINSLLKIEGNYVNINTLDNYSLKEIKELRNNIKNNMNYSKYFDDSYPSLTKNITK